MSKPKPKLFIGIVLDKSSSMLSCRASTISGFNEYMDDQRKKAEGTVLVTLTEFSDSHNIVFQSEDVSNVKPLDKESYAPYGCTALYDAIGFTMQALEDDLKREDVEPGVIFIIITDGYNNASKEFTADQIKALIQQKEEAGNWTFVYLGADIDAAKSNEIGCSNTVSYSKGMTGQTFKAISASTLNYANTKLYSGGPKKSDNFLHEAAEEWDKVTSDAPRGIVMNSKPLDQ